ncbi:MAG: LacI family DNA-binding transcriptional regulator [Bryobacteraceae bacterium]
MATIKEVARRARVSVGTVSNVLTGACPVRPHLRERVEEAMRELNYQINHVARSLKTRQTRTIAMIISDISNPFFPSMMRGAEDAAMKYNYVLLTFNTDDRVERENHVLSVLRLRRVDGLLLVPALERSDAAEIQALIEAGTRVVCVDRVPPGLDVDAVTATNARGAREGVRHLIGLGHSRIAMLAGTAKLKCNITQERVRGYKEALREAGIPFDPNLVRAGDFRRESGYRLGLELLSLKPRPTAFYSCNCLMTLGFVRALRETGLQCPGDAAVVTFDDMEVADVFRPQLTSIAQPSYELGYQAAELLIHRLDGLRNDESPIRIQLKTELKVRESTAGAPESAAYRK